MSDTFDHEGDAWASLDWDNYDDHTGPFWPKGWSTQRYKGNRPIWSPDSLHYHTLITFKELKAQTEKSYLVVTHGKEVWLPKKICRGFSASDKTTYVHAQTFAKILDAARNS